MGFVIEMNMWPQTDVVSSTKEGISSRCRGIDTCKELSVFRKAVSVYIFQRFVLTQNAYEKFLDMYFTETLWQFTETESKRQYHFTDQG